MERGLYPRRGGFSKALFLLTCLTLLWPSPLMAGGLTILLDTSARMREEIRGVPRIEMAIEGLKEFLKRNRGIFRKVTIRTYGTDRCDRGGVTLPVDTGRLEKVFNSLGWSPLQEKAAMIQTLDETIAGSKEREGTILLISGGKEDCAPDPCREVRERIRGGVRIYAIGLILSDVEEMERLKCIASATGGKYFNAHNMEELRTAFRSIERIVAYNLEVRVFESRGKEVTDYLRSRYGYVWWAEVKDRKGKKVASTHTFPARFHLPPGRYDVLIHYKDGEKWLRGVEVKRGRRTTRRVSFAKGTVLINVFDRGKEIMGVRMAPRTQWWCEAYEAREKRKVGVTETFPAEFSLVNGKYDFKIHYRGKEKWLRGVKVEEGKKVKLKVVFP